jgi:hypothetical protein
MSYLKELGFEKNAGFTEHGRIREEGRALGFKTRADYARDASQQYPGMDYAKGTYLDATMSTLLARKQAYMASLEGIENLKALVPFVGMGPKGRIALEQLEKSIKTGE